MRLALLAAVGCAAVELPPPEPEVWLFEEGPLLEVRVWIATEDLDRLREAPREWVPADLEIGEHALEQIAVRLKGNGSFRPIDDEPSLKLNLDRYVDDQELAGLDELVLDNDVSDRSGVRRRLAHERFRAAGVPAPRTAHVQVWINDEHRGAYSLSEAVDGRFLDRWFGDGSGPMYELFDVELDARGVGLLDHDNGPDDRTALRALAATLDDPEARFTIEGARHLDVDAWVRYFAAAAALGHFDAYPYSDPGDDLFLYVSPEDGLIRPIPHGTDEAFTQQDRPVTAMTGRLGRWCMEDPACVLRFEHHLWSVVRALEEDHAAARACALARPVRAIEPDLLRCRPSVAGWIEDRRAALEAMPALSGP